ncbi:ABC transporter ATP-binding protein [Xanthobacter tagetidis]|uniref:ATP-binding cassette domain-containing protein n=1 Tax=Xanthobacter tagetidis TaxID=60216 RepID=A0A3L7A5E4_9HYPH|nr:ATP-binding cassette domain-containing protein [Xanthobacter tagetidis]MBB6310054.1 branched-chain amino acid transport system ATP-binding protein [Xanthobacter tagetidis]RLP75158.1 ATP-binding cassette domain-containing protein [Xanthobacter tagetidis]
MTEMLLRAFEVTKRYGAFTALSGVSFDITKGEVVAVVGPNGAGKTTLVNTLSGLFLPDEGDVIFEGRSVKGLGPSALALRGLARSFQLVTVYPSFTVEEMIAVGAFARAGETFRLLKPAGVYRRERDEVREVAAAFGLAHRLTTPCASLSQGEKKLVDIASALTLRPRLILLDEPTSGISSADKDRIMETLLAAAERLGVESLVLVEHDMELIARYATRVVGLKAGSLVADMPPDAFFRDPEVIDTLVGKVPHNALG